MYTTPKTRANNIEEATDFIDIPNNAVFRCIKRLDVEQENQTITFEEGDVIVLYKAKDGMQFAMFQDIHEMFREGVDNYYLLSHKPFKSLFDIHSEYPDGLFDDFMYCFQFDKALDKELTDWMNKADSIVTERSGVHNRNLEYAESWAWAFAIWIFISLALTTIFPIQFVLPIIILVVLGLGTFRIKIAFENRNANRKAEAAWEELVNMTSLQEKSFAQSKRSEL